MSWRHCPVGKSLDLLGQVEAFWAGDPAISGASCEVGGRKQYGIASTMKRNLLM